MITFSIQHEWSIENTYNNKKTLVKMMVASKQFWVDYLLKSPTINEGYHLVGSSFGVVMDKFNILVSLNCCNFVFG